MQVGLHRLDQVLEVAGDHGGEAGPLHQADPGLDDGAEGPLGADDDPAQVEGGAGRRQGVQVVPGDAPHHLGIAAVDLLGVLVDDPPYLAVGAPLDPGPADPLVELRRPQGAEGGRRAVAEHDLELQDVIDRAPVEDGVGAAGVVADHAAEVGPAARRHVRSELQALGGQGGIQLVENDPGLDARPPFPGVHLDDAVHVPGKVDLQAFAHRLTGQARAAPPGEDGDPCLAGGAKGVGDIGDGARQHDPGGSDLVDARVRGVERPGQGIEADIAFDPGGDRLSQSGHGIELFSRSGRGGLQGHRLARVMTRARVDSSGAPRRRRLARGVPAGKIARKRNIKVDIQGTPPYLVTTTW